MKKFECLYVCIYITIGFFLIFFNAAGGGSKSVPSTKSQSSDGVLQRSANYNLVVLLLAFACYAIKFWFEECFVFNGHDS